jgi:hypothetical protein
LQAKRKEEEIKMSQRSSHFLSLFFDKEKKCKCVCWLRLLLHSHATTNGMGKGREA